MSAHSKIGASSMYRWAECPASVKASADKPNKSSVYAERGTYAHELAAKILEGEDVDLFGLGLEDDEIESIQAYTAHIDSLLVAGATLIGVEQKVNIAWAHPDAFGTADCVLYWPKRKRLHVVDYKHGAGHYVEVQDNPQGLYYLCGAENLDVMKNFQIEEYAFTIVQPRHHKGGIRSATYDTADMLDFKMKLVEASRATEQPDAPYKVGDWCGFCPNHPYCEAKRKFVEETMAFEPHSPFEYDPERLRDDYERIPHIESWIKAIERLVDEEAQAGRPIPGYSLEKKQGNRRWIDAPDVEARVAAIVGEDKAYKKSLISPAQAEKIAGKGTLDDLTERPDKGVKLVKYQLPEGF